MKIQIFLVALWAVIPALSEKIRYDNYKVYRLTPKDEESLAALKTLEDSAFSGYNFWSSVVKANVPVVVMVPPYRVDDVDDMLKELNIEGHLMMENVQDVIDKEGYRPESRAGTFGWTNYHSLDEINAWLQSLSETYPDKVTLLNAGKSYQGRDIIGVKVSFSPENENRSVFMESNIHAREWITSAVNTYILNEFLNSTNSSVREIADYYDWYFFPVFNPDGFHYSHTDDRMWRKTRVPYNIFCYGADPNRNWAYLWNQGGASDVPCSQTYAGPHAFSEPCVVNMATYIAQVREKLVGYISFHSFSQLLMLPYGHTEEHLGNYDELMAIGTTAMDVLKQRYGTEYQTGNIAEIIYIASGTTMDWVKGTYNTTITYTYELRDTGDYGFLLPAEQIIPSGEETLDSIVSIFSQYKTLYPEA